MMIVNNTYVVQLNKFNNLFGSFIFPKYFILFRCLCHMKMHARNFHRIETLPFQHNQIHPFLYFTHKHPHNSLLRPTTLFIFMGLCPYLICSIYCLSASTLFSPCLSLPYFCSISISTIFPFYFCLCLVSFLSQFLPYSQFYLTLSK